jgi:predicted acylesterase/phospholipase RssA
MQSVGLALGGTVRGWEHIGVILAFAEKKVDITHIAGTSMGFFACAEGRSARISLSTQAATGRK